MVGITIRSILISNKNKVNFSAMIMQNKNDLLGLSNFFSLFLIIALIYVVYFPIYKFDFSYDDSSRIKEEVLVTEKSNQSSVATIKQIFSSATFPGDLYRPLTTLAYRIQYNLFNLNAPNFHLFSAVLHLSCTACLLLLLFQLGFSKQISLFTCLLFSVHPINVESVASIAGQAELLSTFFGILGLYLLFKFDQVFLKLVFASILFTLSAFAKESGLIFPLIGFVFSLIFGTKFLQITSFSAATISSGIYLLSRLTVLGGNFFVTRPTVFIAENPLLGRDISFSERILPSIEILGDYLRLLVLPIHLSVDYARGYEFFWSRVYSIDGALSAVLAVSFGLIGLLSKQMEIRIAAIWFYLSFAMTCNLIVPIGTLMAERLCYAPSIGFCLAICGFIFKCLPTKSAPIFLSFIVGLLAFRSSLLLPIWESDRVLLLKMAEIAPYSPKAHYLSGKEYLVVKKDFEKAEYHLRQALALDPSRFGPMRELANLSLQRKDYGRAEYWVRRGLEVNPEEPELRRILGQLQTLKED